MHIPRTVKVQQAGQDIHRGHAGPFVGVAGAGGNESNQCAELPQLQRDLRDGTSRLTPSVHSRPLGAAQGQRRGQLEWLNPTLETPPLSGKGDGATIHPPLKFLPPRPSRWVPGG